MNIPIYRLAFEKAFITKFQTLSTEVLTSGRPLAEDKYVKLFEDKFKKLVGAKYAVAVTNGTVAIELALKVVGVKDKVVLIPADTFFATSIAVTNAGGHIGLVDIEAENFSLDPKALETAIKERLANRQKVGAVIIVHIGGIISKYIGRIKAICKRYRIPLIEDAAHAHFSSFASYRAGTIGEIGCFSFFPTKVMTTGEGGIITTNNKKSYEMLLSLKNFGRDLKNHNICVNPEGNNYKVTELTGLMGVLEIERVKKRIAVRNKLARRYIALLKGSSYTPVVQEKGICAQYKIILKTPIDTIWLKKYCKDKNISLTGEVYRIPIHQQPLYTTMFKGQKFPVADAIAQGHICPPLYPELTIQEVSYICRVLLEAEKQYEKQGRKAR